MAIGYTTVTIVITAANCTDANRQDEPGYFIATGLTNCLPPLRDLSHRRMGTLRQPALTPLGHQARQFLE